MRSARADSTPLRREHVDDTGPERDPAVERRPGFIADTPKQMYAAMGFRPVAIKREYLKVLQ